ncbi:MAG: hypothetical protein A4E65_03540 [Syntrophorhabdus sp. PtaU1.Bin153]|nr:MAG: hypothetical protein A4E65_03540 [Syntrophorhabdus sp. PtaU1.Bin153]
MMGLTANIMPLWGITIAIGRLDNHKKLYFSSISG